METLTDILVGLKQRVTASKNRFQALEKRRRRLNDEITITNNIRNWQTRGNASIRPNTFEALEAILIHAV